jgi:putative transcriptional regulator
MPDAGIRNHIRRLRFENGEMTQEALAKQAGVTRHTIMALEAGKYAPSLLLAFRIAKAFGLPLEQVFQYDGDQAITLRS